jgi:hypothetical protein
MPIFMAFSSAYPLSNRLDNGTTDDRPGIRKKGCVCVGAQCNPFWAVVPARLTGPSRPLREMAGRVFKEEKPLFL